MVDFEEKWRKVLRHIPDQEEYNDHACVYGWGDLPTWSLPDEAQSDIHRYSKRATKKNILVLNHPFGGYRFNGLPPEWESHGERVYAGNLERLLTHKDSKRIDTIIFDYPELYVLDSRRRLQSGEITSVVLTPLDGGGSLFNEAWDVIGENRMIYLAGAECSGCIASTAEELKYDGNRIVLIEDATLENRDVVTGQHDFIKEHIKINDLGFINTASFLKMFGRVSKAKR